MGPHHLMPTGRRRGRRAPRCIAAPLRRVWQFARPYRGTIALFLAAILVAALLGLVPPFVVRAILDTAIPDGDRR